jgi:uncharacterized protein (TIGR00255 family)
MTGYGEVRRQVDSITIGVEVRTINSRYFKLSVRCSDGYASLEPQLEALVRKHVKRGTVQLGLRLEQAATQDDFCINSEVLKGYQQQLEGLSNGGKSISIGELLQLPGVVDERTASRGDVQEIWPAIKETVTDALTNLTQMRSDEGNSMAVDLQSNCEVIASELELIAARTPLVADGYRKRLTERLNKLLGEYDVTVNASDVVREVGLFADRCDISEEIVRLRSHLEQWATIMSLKESSGRKLEFLTQEMVRETNTIGSKANDSDIARHVIEIKAAIERMREMIQNVE